MNQIQTELSIPDFNQVYIKSLEFMCKTLTKDVANLTMEVFELKKILEEKELIDGMGNKIIWKVKEYILQNYSR
jgi:hypothetical protein